MDKAKKMKLILTLLLLFIGSSSPLLAQDCFSQTQAEQLLGLLSEHEQVFWLEEAGYVEVLLDEINYQFDASCGFTFYLIGQNNKGQPFSRPLIAKKLYLNQNGQSHNLSYWLSQKESNSGNYLICNSKNAYTYHKGYCRGLNRCTHGVSRISEAKARALGRRRCKFCW